MATVKQIMMFPIQDMDGNRAGLIAAVGTANEDGGASPGKSVFLKASDTNEQIGEFIRAAFAVDTGEAG